MQVLNGIATLAFIGVGAAVGIRLLLLARRTRRLPETTIGLALLLIGGVGYPLVIAAGTPGAVPPATGVVLLALGSAVMSVGFVAINVFTWTVFRPGAGWGRWLALLLAAGYVVHTVGNGAATLSLESASEGFLVNRGWATLGQALNACTFAWAAGEAYRYWWMLRKRAALGLGDAVTTNRFLLWGIAGTASIATNAVSWWLIFRRLDFFEEPGVQAVIGALAVVSCVAQYLAFLPPRAYVERLRARAG